MSHEQSSTNQEMLAASLNSVSKQFAGKLAVDAVSMAVSHGEFVIITGASGSGKSTLLRMLQGIEKPDTGHVTLLGETLNELSAKKTKQLVRQRVGIGFQAPLLDRNFSVKDNVVLTAGANGHNADNQRLLELAVRLKLHDKLFQEAGSLSGGEQLRVSLMRTLITRPDLLLLDEPTSAIDTKGKEEACAWIKKAAGEDQATVIMVTHDGDVARQFADREYVLDSGRLIDHTQTPGATPDAL